MVAPRVDYSKQQMIQQQLMAAQFQQMQTQSAEATAAASEKLKKERADALAAEVAAEENRKAEAKKKAEAPFVRQSVVTSPFGLASGANTASRSFGLTGGATG